MSVKSYKQMKQPFISASLYSAIIFLVIILAPPSVHAQVEFEEPEVITDVIVRTPYGAGLKNGMTFNLLLTDFGFGIGGQYRRALGNYTEGLVDVGFTVLRDAREQTFVNFFGQQTTPNKYNRILSFPLNIGLRHRLFSESINDNFRFYVQGSGGPVVAFIYPYFDDRNGYGVRLPDQFVYDVFEGWGEGYWDTGLTGKLSFGIDFGSNFRNVSSIEVGYHMNYFPSGIQVLEPNSLEFLSQDQLAIVEGGGFADQKFFGTVMIKFMFGGMW